MNTTLKVSDLSVALFHVSWAIERRATIPILANVRLIERHKDVLELVGTDMDVLAISTAPARNGSDNDAATTINAATLAGILKTLDKDADVSLVSTKDGLSLTSGDTEMSLSTLPADDFPEMRIPDKLDCRIELPATLFREMLDRTRYAVSTEETRFYLCGICFESDGNLFRMVATDGHKMAINEAMVPDEIAGKFKSSCIVPSVALNGLQKLLAAKKITAPVVIEQFGERIAFQINGTRVVSKLVDGSFPNWQRVVPTQNPYLVTVDRQKLLAAVKRAISISNDQSRAFCMVSDNGKLVLDYSSPENGKAIEKIAAIALPDKPIEIGFNGRYMTTILDTLSGASVSLQIADAASPIRIQEMHESINTTVVMIPIRV